MSQSAPAISLINPNYVEPGFLVGQNQRSGAFNLLYNKYPQAKLGTDSLVAIIKTIEVRARANRGQSKANQAYGPEVVVGAKQNATYRINSRHAFDYFDAAAASGGFWDYPLERALMLGGEQGIFQNLVDMLLYGNTPEYGEGLLNTNGATTTSLPPDTNGNSGYATYDPGQLGSFILSIIASIMERMYTTGVPSRYEILAPQSFVNQIVLRGVVGVAQYQRPGGGTQTTFGLVQNILAEAGCEVGISCDDTLIGKGAGGTDAILFIAPGLEDTTGSGINTNNFANLHPNLPANSLMYTDVPRPTRIPTPIPDGGLQVLLSMRATSGWCVRPESLTILSASQY